MKHPDKAEIKKAREDAGLSQTEAATLVYKTLRAWQYWESGDRKMSPAFFELFKSKCQELQKSESIPGIEK